jgi:hypothetical protein
MKHLDSCTKVLAEMAGGYGTRYRVLARKPWWSEYYWGKDDGEDNEEDNEENAVEERSSHS